MSNGIRTSLSIAALAIMTLGAAKVTCSPGVCRFMHYYQVMENAEGRVGPVERIVYSLLLAAQPALRTNPAHRAQQVLSTSSS